MVTRLRRCWLQALDNRKRLRSCLKREVTTGALHLSTKPASQVHRTQSVQRTEAAIPLFKQLLRLAVWLLVCVLGLAGCGNQMRQQARYDTYEPSTFFNDGASARHPPANTVARGRVNLDTHFYQGDVAGAPAETLPFPVTMEVLQRGRERYEIFCAPCHGYDGHGQGMIVQRGFTPPPSFHSERLRAAPPGYYFTVITRGFGTMYSYGERVPPADRWAIIAYIQALQLSQNATLDNVPAEERQQLEAPTQ